MKTRTALALLSLIVFSPSISNASADCKELAGSWQNDLQTVCMAISEDCSVAATDCKGNSIGTWTLGISGRGISLNKGDGTEELIGTLTQVMRWDTDGAMMDLYRTTYPEPEQPGKEEDCTGVNYLLKPECRHEEPEAGDVSPWVGKCRSPVGHPDHCFTCGPCSEGEGGCNRHWQCKKGLVCDSATHTCVKPR
jgi:hypothetical protein